MLAKTSESSMQVLAFDVGGSHIAAGLCSLDDLQVICLASAPLPPGSSCRSIVDLLFHLGSQVASGSLQNCDGAVLAMPGPFDYVAGISHMRHKLETLYGIDLRKQLAKRFGWLPSQFRFLNDAGAFLLGEVAAGAARSAERAVGIALGTGIGSAFARSGRLLTGGVGVPQGGEIWNLPYSGGTVEDLLSTRALVQDYATRTGKTEEVASIAALANTDPDALLVFQTFGLHLGEVFRDILVRFAPDVVVLGGGISRSAPLFLPFAREKVEGLGFHVVISSLLDQAPLVGAAAFWQSESVGLLKPDFQTPVVPDSLSEVI